MSNKQAFAPRCTVCNQTRKDCTCTNFQSNVGTAASLCQCNQGRLPCDCKANVLHTQVEKCQEAISQWPADIRKAMCLPEDPQAASGNVTISRDIAEILIRAVSDVSEKPSPAQFWKAFKELRTALADSPAPVSMKAIYESALKAQRDQLDQCELDKSVTLINLERVTAERDALQQRMTVADQQNDQLRAFANEMISACFEGGSFDGAGIQDIAVKHGLLRIETREVECGEGCVCREYGFPTECYWRTELIALNPTAEAVNHE